MIVASNKRTRGHAKLQLAFLVLLWLQWMPSAHAADEVRVRLFSSVKSIKRITFLAPANFKFGQSEISLGSSCSIERSGVGLLLLRKGASRGKGFKFRFCSVSPINGNPLPVSINLSQRTMHRYLGRFEISIGPAATLQLFNVVKTRDYVDSVVASEAPPGAPAEMLKAQAVLVQTLMAGYAAKKSIDDSTQFERYAGYTEERPEVASAVTSVWGERLIYRDKPIEIFFHSTCAGGTSSAQQYFHLSPGSLPYLVSVKCDYCAHSPFYRDKQVSLPTSRVSGLPNSSPPVILTTDSAKRPLTVRAGQRSVSGYDYWIRLGQQFGWDKVPGTRYTVENQPNGQTLFRSSGAGHGVGMCQWGAIGLAKAGKTYQQILKYYFPVCTVAP